MTLRIETIEVDGVEFKVREPRLSDFLRARSLPSEEFVVSMLGDMLLDEKGEPYGRDKVGDLPLRVFTPLADVVNRMVTPTSDPLVQKTGSSTDSPLPSAG